MEQVGQPAVSETNYSMNYVHWVVEDTQPLEESGIGFEGTAHLSVLSRNADGTAWSEIVFWDDALVTSDNAEDPEAWQAWGYLTENLSEHPNLSNYVNTGYYDPVRNEIVTHTHTDYGGIVWGVDVASQQLTWAFGFGASVLEGWVPDETIIIDEVQDRGLCNRPVFARAHHVTTFHEEGDDPNAFYLVVHDNGGDDAGRRTHTRAIVYHIQLDQKAGTGTADVHWAYPSNPLREQDEHYDTMAYHNFIYGSLIRVADHAELYLLTSGSGSCEVGYNDEGLPTRDHLVLLRAKPEEKSAEVLAVYTPGSDDFPAVTLYSGSTATLYAQVGEPDQSGGRREFTVSSIAQ